MPEPLPDAAITAAAVAIHDLECPDHCEPQAMGSWARARAALEAAAPALRAQGAATERARIRQFAIEHNAQCHHADDSGGAFADLLDGDDA